MVVELMRQGASPLEACKTIVERISKIHQSGPEWEYLQVGFIAINKNGERLIVWGEAISHARGGRLNMRLFNIEGDNTNYEMAQEINIPDYSFPAVVALPNNDFLVLY